MNRRRPRTLKLESLEGRQLLSAIHPADAHRPGLVLDGTFAVPGSALHAAWSGAAVQSPPFPGAARSLGPVEVTFVETSDPVSGRTTSLGIDLANARGTVDLTFPLGFENSARVSRNGTATLRSGYVVAAGTGAYAGAAGQGMFTLVASVHGASSGRITLHTTRSS